MKQSFIVPRKKHFVSLFSKLWISFIALMALFMFIFNGYIAIEIQSFKDGIVNLTQERES